jgi:hypothetical protein
MSASQPLSLVKDYGLLDSSNDSIKTSNPQIIKTGIVYASCSTEKKGGNIGVCNTTTSSGIGSFHINLGTELLYRYGHPAQAVITGIQTGTSTVLTLNHTDTKLRVGDYIQVVGAGTTYDNSLFHKEITEIQFPQQWNNYQTKITINANTNSGHHTFVGVATAAKSIVFVLKPETNHGCTVHLHEVQLG